MQSRKLHTALGLGLMGALIGRVVNELPPAERKEPKPKESKRDKLAKDLKNISFFGRKPKTAVAPPEKLSRKALVQAYGKRQAKRIMLQSNVPGYRKET